MHSEELQELQQMKLTSGQRDKEIQTDYKQARREKQRWMQGEHVKEKK